MATAKRVNPLSGSIQQALIRELAAGDVSRAQLARKYGVDRSAVTFFAQRHAREIDDLKAGLVAEFTEVWIADKEQRIVAHQQDYEMARKHPNAAHHEWIRARTGVLHAVAEELGQLPPRQTVSVSAVVHIVESVDLDALT